MCAKGFAKMILVVFNIGFFVLGTILLGLGIFFLASKTQGLAVLSNLPQEGQDAINALNVPGIIHKAAIALTVAGAFLFVVSFLGCCGALKEVRCFLIVYIIIVVLVVVIQLAMVIAAVAFKDTVEVQLKTFMKKTITVYDGLTFDNDVPKMSNNSLSITWDTLQFVSGCCGADGIKDYDDAKNWTRKYTYDKKDVVPKVPASCCKLVYPFSPDDIKNVTFVDIKGCLTKPSEADTNLIGCYEDLKNEFVSNSQIALIVGLVTALVEILGIISACYLCRTHGDYKSV